MNFLLDGSGSTNNNGSGIWTFVMLGLVLVVFYFLLIRPEKKRAKQANEMRSALQVGDEVTTIGGIIGVIISIKEETFVLETTRDKTHIRFFKWAVRSVDVKADGSDAPDVAPATEGEPLEK